MATATRKKKVSKPVQITKVIYVLDASGSIDSYNLRNSVIKLTNKLLSANKDASTKEKQKTEVSIITFDYPDNIEYIYEGVNINRAREITREDYVPNGSTALFDAVGQAINDGLADPNSEDENVSFLLVAITDGGENASVKYNHNINQLIQKAQNKGNWTITFQVPKGYSNTLSRLGISRDNIREWEPTERGIKDVEVSTSAGFNSYYNSRSRGVRSMSNFYVQTDLSHLTPRQLKRELIDLSDEYGIFTAPNEMQIRDFVESKTKKEYKKGQAYYQLLKNELVQSNKEILIFDKASTAIYGGDEARDLIGLPIGQNAKVNPGNHANYEIFVQSTSVNRKLLRGNKVAIRMV